MANNVSQDQSPPEEDANAANSKTVSVVVDGKSVCEIEGTLYPDCHSAPKQRSKTPSFQITSVYVGSNSRTSNDDCGNDSADDLDESDTSDFSADNSRITDTENETSYCTEDTFSKDDIYFNLNHRTIASVPVIPTSSQYGLAIVGSEGENCANDTNLIKAAMVCANNISTCNASVTVTETGSVINMIDNTKSDIEMRDCPPQHASRNERFRVVKIESTEPFRCGRWICMDYLDHNILQMNKSQLDIINSIKQLDSDSSTGTVNFIPPGSSLPTDSPLLRNVVDEQDYPYHFKPVAKDNQFNSTQQNTINLTTAQVNASFPNSISPGQSIHQEHMATSTQNSISVQPQEVNNQSQQINAQYQQLFTDQHNQQQSISPQFNPQLQQNNQRNHGVPETQQMDSHAQPPSQQATQQVNLQEPQVIYQPQFNSPYSRQINPQPQEVQHGNALQNMILMQQILQGQNFQQGHMQQVSQVQGMTQPSMQSVSNLPPTEALQSLPPQQLQQILNAILQQMGNQPDRVQQQHLIQQVSQQLLQQYQQQQPPQCYGQDSLLPIENALATVEICSENTIADASPQRSQTVASAVTMPVQISGPGMSHNLQMAQMQIQQQQQQQQTPVHSQQQHVVNQPTMQPIAMNQTHQQVPVQLQYTVQQQYPVQHPQFQQFPIPVHQVPLVQLYPIRQQQPLSCPAQQQVLQQSYHQMPNTQQSGLFTHNVPVGDSRSAPNLSQGHNVSQSCLIQGADNYRSPSLQQNYVHQNTCASQSELYFTPPSSRTEKQVTGSRSMSAVRTDSTPGTPTTPNRNLQSPGWFSSGSCRFEMTSERPSLDRLGSQSDSFFDVESAREDPDGTLASSAVAIDNKIEQAMDLVKSHLMFAVREEVEVLKEKIAELTERITQLEVENNLLRSHATPEVLAMVISLPQQPEPSSSQPPPYPPKDSV